MDNRDRLIGVGFIVIVVLLVFGLLSPPSQSGDVTKYQENEILLKSEIKRKDIQIKTLKSRDSVWEASYKKLQDSVDKKQEQVTIVRTVYLAQRKVNEANPDSADYKSEALAGRKVIDRQEAHINALLALNLEADKLLASKIEIIEAQEEQISLLSERFDNMITAKDAEINAEIKRGNKKGKRGFGLGFLFGYIAGKAI